MIELSKLKNQIESQQIKSESIVLPQKIQKKSFRGISHLNLSKDVQVTDPITNIAQNTINNIYVIEHVLVSQPSIFPVYTNFHPASSRNNENYGRSKFYLHAKI